MPRFDHELPDRIEGLPVEPWFAVDRVKETQTSASHLRHAGEPWHEHAYNAVLQHGIVAGVVDDGVKGPLRRSAAGYQVFV